VTPHLTSASGQPKYDGDVRELANIAVSNCKDCLVFETAPQSGNAAWIDH